MLLIVCISYIYRRAVIEDRPEHLKVMYVPPTSSRGNSSLSFNLLEER